MSDPLETEKIKGNIRRLSDYIDTAYIQTDNEKFLMLGTYYSLFSNQIEVLYKGWFPRAKAVSDIDIINHLYKDIFKKDEKQYVKFGMQCLLRSINRVFEAIEESEKNGNVELFNANIRLLHEIAFEAPIFLDLAFEIMENITVDFGHGRRFKLDSRETFKASEFVLKQFIPKNLVGDYAISPASIFLIRQAIELWLQDIFGIDSVWDDKAQKFIKVQPEKLFSLLDSAGKAVKLPVPKSTIQKIHSWTQRYVHNGIKNSVWEIEHAQYVLSPLFVSGNVIIQKKYYESVEENIQKVLRNSFLKLNRRKQYSSTVIEE